MNTKEKLESAGVRPSNQRVLIYDYLKAYGQDSNIKEMWEHCVGTIPSLSMTTAYNTVALFLNKGLLRGLKTVKQLKTCTIKKDAIKGYMLYINGESLSFGNLNTANYFRNHYKALGYSVKKENW